MSKKLKEIRILKISLIFFLLIPVKTDQLFELTKKNRSKVIFLFLGAGTVTEWAQNFARELKKIYE